MRREGERRPRRRERVERDRRRFETEPRDGCECYGECDCDGCQDANDQEVKEIR